MVHCHGCSADGGGSAPLLPASGGPPQLQVCQLASFVGGHTLNLLLANPPGLSNVASWNAYSRKCRFIGLGTASHGPEEGEWQEAR